MLTPPINKIDHILYNYLITKTKNIIIPLLQLTKLITPINDNTISPPLVIIILWS